jgi:hypothetical protein
MNRNSAARMFQIDRSHRSLQKGVMRSVMSTLLIFLFSGLTFSQSTAPPRHTRLLYSADLMSVDPSNPIGQIVSANGSFVAGKGWTASNTNGQLRINLAEALPFEGTAEITISNLNPYDQMYKQLKSKTAYTPFSLWSRPRFGYGALYSTMGSYLYMMSETNPKYNFEYKSNWKVLSQGFYGRGPRENVAPYGDYTKSEPDSDKAVLYYANKEYKFKLIWSIGKAWVTIEDTVLQEHNFNGQIESFRYLCMGMNEMGLSLVGPVYKNLKIYAPENPVILENVAFSTGVASDAILGACGICWADINKDGLEDAFIPYTGLATAKPNVLLLHKTNHTFANEASSRGVLNVPSARVAAFGDVDGDGDADLFVGTDKDGTYLFINNGLGVFQDVSASRGISDKGVTTGTRQLLVQDIDNDADLDLLVVTTGLTRLYLNNGKGIFTVADRGINTALNAVGTITRGVAAGDVNMDGAVDLVFTRANQPPVLLINDGKGQYVSQGTSRGLTSVYAPNDPTLVDYDNDGDLDLFIANQAMASGTIKQVACYTNDGSGRFTDKTNTVNILTDAKALMPADVNNDGWQDFIVLRNNMDPSSVDYSFRNISKLFINQGNGSYTELTGTGAEINFAGIQAGGAVDYNQDGLLDISGIAYGGSHTDVAPSGTTVDEFGRQYLLRNKTTGRHYIQIALKDSSGGFSRTEARVWIYQSGKAGQEGYLLGYRDSGGNTNPQSHSSPILHFGIGANVKCDVVVRYGTGARMIKSDVAADQLLTLLRPAKVAEAGALVRISPASTSGPAGGFAADSLVVKVLDTDQMPLAGHPVVFKVLEGTSFLNGPSETEKRILTNAQGLAKAAWRLDARAGQNNRVSAEAVNSNSQPLNGSPLYFTAVAHAANPAVLLKMAEGDNQSGRILSTLVRPFQVRVTDSFGNPVANHTVLFQVESTQGTLNGNRSLSLLTDEAGLAQATLTLGSLPGVYSVAASSQFNSVALNQSPQQFHATAFTDPAILKYVSGDSSIGIINQILTQPLKVQVTDEQQNPISGHSVRFVVRQGGGSFDGQATLDVVTDQSGFASARPVLGSAAGAAVNIFEAQAQTAANQPLLDSPVRFTVSAKKTAAVQLILFSGNEQAGQAEAVLPNPLQVKVVDRSQQAVAGHDVQFSVVQGSGALGETLARQVSVKTDQDGMARIVFALGRELGINTQAVSVESSDGIAPLQNSGSRFTASALYGQPDTLYSEISATGPIAANGTAAAQIKVRLLDAQKNPVPGERVTLFVNGTGNIIDQPQQPTDAQGETTGVLRSTHAELKTVTARVTDSNTLLKNSTRVQFSADTPSRMVVVSGNEQNGIINSALLNPLVVQVLDRFDNPVQDVQIILQPEPLSGHFEPAMALNSDADGKITAQWILGTFVGTQRGRLSLAGGIETTCTAHAALPSQTTLVKYKGDGQFSKPDAFFSDSLLVRVITAGGAPIFGVPVQFTVLDGSALLIPNSLVYSDQAGLCGVRLQAGSTQGLVRIKAGINDDFNVVFTVSVGNSIPAQMVIETGSRISAEVNTVVKNITFRVVDVLNNPVADAHIAFVLSSDGGQILSPQPVRTGADGRATIEVRAGTKAGVYTLAASCAGLAGDPIHLTLQVLPGAAAQLLAVSGNHQQGRGNEIVLYPLKVRVQDQYENEVPQVPVQFVVKSGGGRLVGEASVKTDSSGIASVFWQLGTLGEQVVLANSELLPNQSAVFDAQLLANQPPILSVVADTSIQETRTLILNIRSTDPEGTRVVLSVAHLPEGATFDPVNGKLIVWTPTLAQQGDYTIEITAQDQNGGTTVKQVHIHVLNMNQPPSVHVTPDSSYLALQYFRPFTFSASAQDPDHDSLSYYWRLGGTLIGRETRLVMIPTPTMKNSFNLELVVKDCCDSVKYIWNIQIMTFVELNEFRVAGAGGALRLSWSSASERNNAGFNVMAGYAAEGPFRQLNESIITPRSDGQYEFKDTPKEWGRACYYMLQAVALDGSVQEFGPISSTPMLPTELSLEQNYPNPFNPQTTIAYQVDAVQRIDVVIYDLLGRVVRTLYSGPCAPGYHQLIWDGHNDQGLTVPSGLYHCVMVGQRSKSTIKLLLLK